MSATFSRRNVLFGTTLALASAGLGLNLIRSRHPLPLPDRSADRAPSSGTTLKQLDWSFPESRSAPSRCVVLWPVTQLAPRIPPGHAVTPPKLSLLVAFHGAGETRDPRSGAYGWLESYRLDAAFAALEKPPIAASAFQDFVTAERLAQVNRELAARPFPGLVVACPNLPKGFRARPEEIDSLATFVRLTLLPKLRAETPIFGDVSHTGVDGVSLGGMTALRLGLQLPDIFGVLGALQPAIGDPEEIAEQISQKLHGRSLRLVTSDGDYFREVILSTSALLKGRNISHSLLETLGPHDYVWNQGPGAIEMLHFHGRSLG